MPSKKGTENEWTVDIDPRSLQSKWSVNSGVGNLPKQLTKKVAKYHATKGRKKI